MGARIVMVSPENRLFHRPDALTDQAREQQRLEALAELGLLEAESVPVFEEATQTAAHFLDIPICVLGLMDQDREWLKSAVGLSRLGLMNDIAASRQIPRHESFGLQVVESRRVLVINDAKAEPTFADSLLTQRYGVRAYLGVPLLNSTGHCLGTLAVMDLMPRNFTVREIEFLELTARWSVSEYERNYLLKLQQNSQTFGAIGKGLGIRGDLSAKLTDNASNASATRPLAMLEGAIGDNSGQLGNPNQRGESVLEIGNSVKVQLLSQLTQELRTPLTSVMGMASVLNREIYGPLTSKQKEYLGIVYQSGQYLLSLVNEIVELSNLDDGSQSLNLTSVDIEMLCQQAINTLEQAATRRDQQIRLSIEPGHRIWLLDKNKIRQLLYHLVFSVIQASSAGSVVRIHVSRKQNRLNLSIWVSHPWLGESLPHADFYPVTPVAAAATVPEVNGYDAYAWGGVETEELEPIATRTGTVAAEAVPETDPIPSTSTRINLGLLLSQQLAELHNGEITIQGSPEAGYRYVVSLPQITGAEEQD